MVPFPEGGLGLARNVIVLANQNSRRGRDPWRRRVSLGPWSRGACYASSFSCSFFSCHCDFHAGSRRDARARVCRVPSLTLRSRYGTLNATHKGAMLITPSASALSTHMSHFVATCGFEVPCGRAGRRRKARVPRTLRGREEVSLSEGRL